MCWKEVVGNNDVGRKSERNDHRHRLAGEEGKHETTRVRDENQNQITRRSDPSAPLLDIPKATVCFLRVSPRQDDHKGFPDRMVYIRGFPRQGGHTLVDRERQHWWLWPCGNHTDSLRKNCELQDIGKV